MTKKATKNLNYESQCDDMLMILTLSIRVIFDEERVNN
jgi:hypothetical protein